MRPSKGTISAQIWAIADAHSRPGAPAFRDEVVARAVALGLHPKTASTQFGAWKRSLHPEFDGTNRRRTPDAAPLVTPGLQQAGPRPEPAAVNDRHWGSLLKNGFTYGADWLPLPEGQVALDRPAPQVPGVYIFVEVDQVVYVGTTRRRLADRMADYRRGHPGQRTSARIKALLVASVTAGREIRVLFATPGDTTWNGLPVEIAAGLEAGLIARFQPEWNKKGL